MPLPTTPPSLTVPGAAPSASNPATFDGLMDARLTWENTNVTEMTTTLSWIQTTAAGVYADAGTAYTASTAAGASATLAINSASAAALSEANALTYASAAQAAAGLPAYAGHALHTLRVNAAGNGVEYAQTEVKGDHVLDFGNKPSTTTGTTYGYYGGPIRSDVTTTLVADGTVALTVSATNYIQCDASGTVSKNTVGFTAGQYPMAVVVCGASTITSITDKRAMAVVVPTPSNIVQIGAMTPMTQTADVVTIQGYDYQRSGVLATSGYTSAPLNNFFQDGDYQTPATGTWVGGANGNGITLVISNGSTTSMRSFDNGKTWEAITLPAAVNSICFGAGLFVATANASANTYTSPDGVNWATVALPAVALGPIIFANALFVAVNVSGTAAATSPDAITWTPRTVPSVGNCRSLAYGGGSYVGVDSTGGVSTCIQSTNGTTWNSRTLPTAHNWSGVAFGNALFVAVANNSTTDYATSPDGITWTTRALPTSAARLGVACVGNMFLVTGVGTTAAHTSIDGLTWVSRTLNSVSDGGSSKLFAVEGGVCIPINSSTRVKVMMLGYGRGAPKLVFADQQNRLLPFYMRMS